MMRTASTALLLHAAMVSGQGCSNACSFANNGQCDDRASAEQGAASSNCPQGSDCADCVGYGMASLTTPCDCNVIKTFMESSVKDSEVGTENACANAVAGCIVSTWTCSVSSEVRCRVWETLVDGVLACPFGQDYIHRTIDYTCDGASDERAAATPAPSTPTPAATPAATDACAGMSNTDHCCKDGAPDDYPCRATYTCGKGTCLRATYKLCTDAVITGDYQCSSTETCGRGICVGATKTLCGTSGTTTCGATQTCCGTSPATKNTDMVCNTNMDPCPADQKSDTSYSSAPYEYGGGSSSDSSSIGPIIGGVGE